MEAVPLGLDAAADGDMGCAPPDLLGGPFGDEYGVDGDTGCPPCDDCQPYGDWDCRGPFCGPYARRFLRYLSVFAGGQGFKGPLDLGRNGNFGFHEGLNWGGPIGDPWGFGFQIGAQAVQSDFLGNQVVTDGGGVPQIEDKGRNQVFLTAGIFQRALDGGLQGGVVFDYLHDSFFAKADLKQIRSETSLVLDGPSEIGFFGAYGLGGDTIETNIPFGRGIITPLQPNDIYALFYRLHFSGGGQGRVWGGLSGHGDGLIGAEATVPLGNNWSLENNFAYLIPKQGTATGGQQNESWSVVFSLVWYPGRPARSVYSDPYTPLFGVADNSTFLIRRGN